MEIDFMESIKGASKNIVFEKKGVCITCNGSKAKPGTSPTRCSACGGKGTVNYRQGPMTI
jgi:molecular chaperone DnaJ